MKEKRHNPVKALKKAFQEELDDQELQRNYDSFQDNLKASIDKKNELLEKRNKNLIKVEAFKESILRLAMEGETSTDLVKKVKDLERKNNSLNTNIGCAEDDIAYYQWLIEKYESKSDCRFYVWWKAFKEVDPDNTKSWIDWISQYENKII